MTLSPLGYGLGGLVASLFRSRESFAECVKACASERGQGGTIEAQDLDRGTQQASIQHKERRTRRKEARQHLSFLEGLD